MSAEYPTRSDLATLSGQDAGVVDLEALLPPGRLIKADEGEGEPSLWLSATAPSAELWEAAYQLRERTGLWPLLLEPMSYDSGFRPWGSGELSPSEFSSPDIHDHRVLLETWWEEHTQTDSEDDFLSVDERVAVTAPYGQRWPGPAPGSLSKDEPDLFAFGYAEHLVDRISSLRLGLVAARRGSDALASVGWNGPLNYTNDTGEIAAIVRSWEDRFGAMVVGVGSSDLYLSVSAPPSTHEEALHIAAEHFAFCADNIWQNSHPATLTSYAEHLIGHNAWEFWWD